MFDRSCATEPTVCEAGKAHLGFGVGRDRFSDIIPFVGVVEGTSDDQTADEVPAIRLVAVDVR